MFFLNLVYSSLERDRLCVSISKPHQPGKYPTLLVLDTLTHRFENDLCVYVWKTGPVWQYVCYYDPTSTFYPHPYSAVCFCLHTNTRYYVQFWVRCFFYGGRGVRKVNALLWWWVWCWSCCWWKYTSASIVSVSGNDESFLEHMTLYHLMLIYTY